MKYQVVSFRFALLLFLVFLLAGCVGLSHRRTGERVREVEEIDTYVQETPKAGEELMPAAGEPETVAAEPEEISAVVSAVPDEEELPPAAPTPPESAAIEIRHVSGYRVQLFATTAPEIARNFAESARNHFEEKVYVEYLEPYYKVRVGDCLTREEARLLLERTRAAGFDEAWIAGTLVIRMGRKLP